MKLGKTALKALFAAVGLAAAPSAFALAVTASSDCMFLANTLAGGGGVTITGCTLTGASSQQGTFTGGIASGIGIESGVLLTSGSVTNAPGPNNALYAGTFVGTAGDADLDSLISDYTYDANILTLTFTTTTGSLFFNYVFASEEYTDNIGLGYNDVFGAFLDGVNIALIPSTSMPVAVDNINCGYPFAGMGPNCHLYHNNDPAEGGPFFDIQYDGFTDVFTASATGLTPGTVYTLKLAIADVGDGLLDSGVFLQAGSFVGAKGSPHAVPEPSSLALLTAGLIALLRLCRRQLLPAQH